MRGYFDLKRRKTGHLIMLARADGHWSNCKLNLSNLDLKVSKRGQIGMTLKSFLLRYQFIAIRKQVGWESYGQRDSFHTRLKNTRNSNPVGGRRICGMTLKSCLLRYQFDCNPKKRRLRILFEKRFISYPGRNSKSVRNFRDLRGEHGICNRILRISNKKKK